MFVYICTNPCRYALRVLSVCLPTLLVIRLALLVLELAEHVDHALRGVSRGGHAGVHGRVLAADHAGLVVDLGRRGFWALETVKVLKRNIPEEVTNCFLSCTCVCAHIYAL